MPSMDRIPIGKHRGRLLQYVVLTDPKYVVWMLTTDGIMGAVAHEARILIAAFDARPFAVACAGTDCSARATRCSAYDGSTNLFPWCDRCDPLQRGADPGSLRTIQTYESALLHVKGTCQSNKDDFRKIIRQLAEAKGLPKRLTETQAEAFFADYLRFTPFDLRE